MKKKEGLETKVKHPKIPFRKKLLKGLREYFLGTETKSYYKHERAFYKELLEKKDFEEYLENSEREESKYLFLSKYLPFLIEDIGMIVSIATLHYEWVVSGLFSGESLRAIQFYYNPVKNNKKDLKHNIGLLDDGNDLEENALEMLKHCKSENGKDDEFDKGNKGIGGEEWG